MGTCNSAELFHQTMPDTVKDIEGVAVYIDDLLIHVPTLQLHNERLEAVMIRLKEAGLTLNRRKSVFARQEVKYLGHELSPSGVRPQANKIQAVCNMVVPKDKADVERFLGFVNYLAKFIDKLSELIGRSVGKMLNLYGKSHRLMYLRRLSGCSRCT